MWKEISGNQDIVLLGKREVNSRQYMSWFNFRGGDQQKLVKDLSGGERNRVHLAKLLKSGGNVLLLDEPTNDLDVDTLRALEDALLDFAGCAVVITHDRWFLDRIATHILAFEGDSQVTWFEGSWGEYAAWVTETRGPEALEPHRIAYKPLVRAVIDLPVADPGRPDTRSPFRLLVWVGRHQKWTLTVAITFGIVWLVAQALMPFAIGQAIQQGVVEGDNDALARFCVLLAVLGVVQAAAGVMRHRYAVQNWLQASFRLAQVVGHHVAHTGDAVRGELSTGEVVAVVSNDVLRAGGAFEILARLAGGIVSYIVVAVILLSTSTKLGLIVLLGVPMLTLSLSVVIKPLQQRQREQREEVGQLTALGRRHRRGPARAARRRRRAGVLRPLPAALRERSPRRRQGRDAPVDARRRAGAPARAVRRARDVGRRAPRGVRGHHGRPARRVLRLRRLPRHSAANLGGGGREDHARARRRAPDAAACSRSSAPSRSPSIRCRSRPRACHSATPTPG